MFRYDPNLLHALKAKCMVFISGYESDLYNDLLTRREGSHTEKVSATTKGNNGKCFPRKEVLWFNEAYLETMGRGRIGIRFSEKERKNSKVNPVR
jgi:hypothetical protein